jgi:hypothetical protein
MDLGELVQKTWSGAKEKAASNKVLGPVIKRVRDTRSLVWHNYISDIVAGNASRTPVYAVFDNLVLDIPDEKVIASAGKALKYSACMWSMVYSVGSSIMATALGETYQKHKKKFDMAYSSAMTFGFGMAVSLGAGYSTKQALYSSSIRAALAIPLGPITRYYTDALRQMRGEPKMNADTHFKDKPWYITVPQAAGLVIAPLALAATVVMNTPDKPHTHLPPAITVPAKASP